MGKSERLHSFCCDTHTRTQKSKYVRSYMQKQTHMCLNAHLHTNEWRPLTHGHIFLTRTHVHALSLHETRVNYHVKLPLYPHTHTHTHTLLSNPPTPLCTPCLMSPFTLLYNTPGSLKGTTSHSSFTGPYIHNTIMFARRWPEKKEPCWYTCSSETSVWETSPWRSERTCGSYPMARC